MSWFKSNLKFLRKKKGLTQAQLADKLSLNRSAIGAYEEGRADPRLKTLLNICHYFTVSPDLFLNWDLAAASDKTIDVKGDSLRILPVTINKETGRETVPLVPQKAAAGYTSGYADVDYIESLTQFDLPFGEIHLDRTYRMFQIDGDSMLPIPSGSYILAGYVMDWSTIKDDKCYILLTKDDGIVYKRVYNHFESEGRLHLHSDNPQYEPYSLKAEDILEVWQASAYFCFELPEKGAYQPQLTEMMEMVSDLKSQIGTMKKN